MEKEINQLKNQHGCELMNKAAALFEKDAENGAAKYKFSEEDCDFLIKDLQLSGFKKFLDESIGQIIFSVSLERLKFLKTRRNINFLMPIGFSPSREKFGNKFKELRKINGFKLALDTETIPTKKNVIKQHQELVLFINTNHFFFLENEILTMNNQQKEIEKIITTEIRKPELKEIRLFEQIIKKI